jgi:hypothetical protein
VVPLATVPCELYMMLVLPSKIEVTSIFPCS